jgi:hypothetical protein
MFDLFVVRDTAERRVKRQFETPAKARRCMFVTVDEEPRRPRRRAGALAVRLLPALGR